MSEPRPPVDQISHYRLAEKVGEGTYGVVWRGVHHRDPELQVAVKVLRPELTGDAAFIESLKGECRRLDRLDHPSIVRFRELAFEGELVALVLELLRGDDLWATLGKGALRASEALRVLEPVLEGLAHAHEHGVVHRDIKPSNVFVCEDGRIKLLDFGIARAADDTHATRTGQLIGTLDYMAPERFTNQGGGKISDVYGVGLLAWEMLAGRQACMGKDLAGKMGWHLGVGPADLRTVRPECPAWLAEVVAAYCDMDLAKRPADAGAALALLRARSEPVTEDLGQRVRRAPRTVSVDRASLPPPISSSAASRPAASEPPPPAASEPPPPAASEPPPPAASEPPPPAASEPPPPAASEPPSTPVRLPPPTGGRSTVVKVGAGLAGGSMLLLVVGTAVVLVLLVLAIAIPNYVAMQNRAKRAEVPSNIDGIKTAEMAYDAAFDQFIEIDRYHPDAWPGQALRPWRSGSPYDTLGWAPDGEVRGSYKVSTAPFGASDFVVTGISDVDGDGVRASYTATKSINSVLNTYSNTF